MPRLQSGGLPFSTHVGVAARAGQACGCGGNCGDVRGAHANVPLHSYGSMEHAAPTQCSSAVRATSKPATHVPPYFSWAVRKFVQPHPASPTPDEKGQQGRQRSFPSYLEQALQRHE